MYGFYQNKPVWPWCHTTKILLMIKLTAILLFITMLQVSAATLAQKVTLNVTNAPLERVFDSIRDQSGVDFFFSASLIGKAKPVSIHIKDMELDAALAKIFRNQPLTYAIRNNSVQVKAKEYNKLAKPGRISGKIVDEKGETPPGANVKVVETGAGTQAGADGSYILNLQPGIYTLEFSYVSFATQRVTGVVVTEGKNTPLDISLKTDSRGLKEVVVTSGYKKASTEGLLIKQKNASEISNGISAEQIARTPDKNIGESLKRISGVNTVDNKFVLVRGIGERYNSAMLDGVILPSTEAQTRNFSFDLIPANLVDNVIVSKTVTPDMNASFGGGLIQINTKDIPTENFMSFTAGTSYNDQSTGKDFFSHQRGKYDYFGFDDGRRKFPTDLQHTDRGVAPNTSLTDAEFQQKVDQQSQKFKTDNFTLYKYKAAPSQNYQFTIGRLIAIDTANQNKLGFTGALSYRNTQSINNFDQQHRNGWDPNFNNYGATYDFNTTLGALLNVGLQLGKNRFSLRNTYTHLYDNALIRTTGYDWDNGPVDMPNGVPPNQIQEADDPTFTNLLQNKLSGQHQLGKFKIDWNVARTGIDRKEKDLSIATSMPVLIGNEYRYFYIASPQIQAQIVPMSRHNYHNQETNYSWQADVSTPFVLGNLRNTVKAGYFGINRRAKFNWQIASFIYSANRDESLRYIPLSEMVNPANFGANGYNYAITQYYLDNYEGKSSTHAGYLMFDTRLMEKLRMVWGLRTEYYKYTEIRNGQFLRGTSEFQLPPEKAWQFLPSANLTYSPVSQINLRAAVSSSVVRPELMDNSQFFKYSPLLGAQFGNQGLSSTRINSYDLKAEWFPGLGEIISAGAFYKKFDKPAELTFSIATGNINYYLENAASAKVYGLEFELRKNLAFINSNKILSNITLYGNLTLQKSSVLGSYKIDNPDKTVGGKIRVPVKQERSMYGQSPYLVNAGLQYTGDHFGLNLAYNKSGYKTYIVSFNTNQIEYEMPREQIDAQISYRFLKKRFEIKLNAGNLLNSASTFFANTASYDHVPFTPGTGDNGLRLKEGFTDKYEEGDQIRFKQRFGRTYSTSLTYNF
jgi:outer membrane receptor protein involved in Fe transport